MSVEKIRLCNYRKVGGLYLVGAGLSITCDRLPFPIHACPHCGEGVRVTGSLKMISASVLFANTKRCPQAACECPLSEAESFGRVGLMGVGSRYYKTPQDFVKEALELGVSKRIPQIPRELVLGKTWVFLTHSKAVEIYANDTLLPEIIVDRYKPGVFYAFIPERIEYISDDQESQEKIDQLEHRGVTIVKVPRDDPDHQ